MSNEEDFLSRKNERRKKIKNKDTTRKVFDDTEEKVINRKLKREIKKQKEEIYDEEWEDWDRYYNH